MPKFAYIETGRAIDPMTFASLAAYLGNFTPASQVNWTVKQVPDDTQPGDFVTLDGQGNVTSVTPPAVQTPAPTPKPLTDTDFAEYCYAKLGVIAAPTSDPATQTAAGMVRRGGILLACKNTNDPATYEAFTRFTKATTYEQADVATFLAIIGPGGSRITTQAENDAIINEWPVQ